MRISEVSTPAAVIDLDILESNLRRNVDVCRASQVSYRPHIKTHKIPALAHKQVQAGAHGITCAKIGEAEVMARAGVKDIFIANCLVGWGKFERLVSLCGSCHLSTGVDSRESAAALSEFFRPTTGRWMCCWKLIQGITAAA